MLLVVVVVMLVLAMLTFKNLLVVVVVSGSSQTSLDLLVIKDTSMQTIPIIVPIIPITIDILLLK
jgi:hypothetical protein